LNFSIDTRFDPGERDIILRLLEASGARLPRPGEPRPKRLLPASVRRAGAAFPPVASLAHLRRPPVISVSEFCRVAEDLTGQPLTCQVDKDFLRWAHGRDTWAYPASTEKMIFFGFLTAVDPARWLGAKYTLPGFVEIEMGDLVIDCGSFVGGFTRAALRAGASVIAVEPSRVNRRCLEENLKGCQVDIRPVGLGPVRGKATFRESSTGVDSTFGRLDEGIPTGAYPVDIVTVDELCRSAGTCPALLKVEAEGMEDKILSGMAEFRPAKVAVDASPEGGSDNRATIARRLRYLGYTVRTDLNMIYGRR
jgi:FkbM family methyltransferase